MDCLRDKFIRGQILDGRFQTVAPLNHGSFGMVFLANDNLTGDQVAIKCMTKASASDTSSPVAVDERSEELECHARLRYHPNIVNLIHAFETSSHNFLVLEYCSMGDLYEAIRHSRGPLETQHVREFMLQLIDAVDYMHSKGLYHRDIKPENIFLSQDGAMKLGDFGLATRSPWSFEACVGSDRYMAPEQYEPTAAGYSPAKADIWSIGICLLNILFSRNPFITPTESDVLFGDYTRDRQSLFDVFPNMSQDTFEILASCLALDPEKRSLSAMRDGIMRAVSFTTDDETLDEFCTEDRDVVAASAYREPLRTPSIQSPQVNQGDSFPWAKALQSTAQHAGRRLSAIPDAESYTEDLFPPSEAGATSWCSIKAVSPSIDSTLDSTLGASFKSMKLQRPEFRYQPSANVGPISESLPNVAGRPIPAISMVFGNGKSDQVSKSWSDLWDEEESENEELRLRDRQAQNARTWSHDSKEDTHVARPVGLGLSELRENSPALNSRANMPNNEIDTDTDVETVVPAPTQAKDIPRKGNTAVRPTPQPSHHSPYKPSTLDKWAALGRKRRNYHSRDGQWAPSKSHSPTKGRRKDTGYDHGTWTKKKFSSKEGRSNSPQKNVQPYMLSKDWRRDPIQTFKPKKEQCPFLDFGSVVDDDDFDFIGGWQDLHP